MKTITSTTCACLTGLAMLIAGGCGDSGNWTLGTKGETSGPQQQVPEPVNLLLPESVSIHPFTGRTFAENGGISGIDVRIETLDHYGDPTKAFGEFRFELYGFVPNRLDPKGKRIASWEESLLDPGTNLLHWDKITRMYIFKLQWAEPIAVDRRVVLVATFDSPFTDRMSTERQFVLGQ